MIDRTWRRYAKSFRCGLFALAATTLSAGCTGGSHAAQPATPGAATSSEVEAAQTPASVWPHPTGAIGYAISWPQCGAALPRAPFQFGIVGVADGMALTTNPCLDREYAWAHAAPRYVGLYLNTNLAPGSNSDLAAELQKACADKGPACEAYLYGQVEGDRAFSMAAAAGATAPMWWLDVQIVSSWSEDVELNALSIRGAIDQLRSHGVRVGISSTPFQWHEVAGDYAPGLPGWVAGAADEQEAALFCDGRQDFGGGRTEQIAYVKDGFEMVRGCGDAPAKPRGRSDRGLGD
jgi:hypothetical protein